MACIELAPNSALRVDVAPAADLPADDARASWEAITTWSEIAAISSLGPRGLRRNAAQFRALACSVTTGTGAVDYSSIALTCGHRPEDPGQLLLQAAASARSLMPIRIRHHAGISVTEYLAVYVQNWQHGSVSAPDNPRLREAELIVRRYREVPNDPLGYRIETLDGYYLQSAEGDWIISQRYAA